LQDVDDDDVVFWDMTPYQLPITKAPSSSKPPITTQQSKWDNTAQDLHLHLNS